ncbi:gephyrin-like molybdotransferase Glp [Pedobacter aquatilis]|uniref:molybdopterin molybdotransferase MoeA n=1 Tax=Pedobacter aquatilis TaxID=351343 RepID=UPI00292FA1AD|nr:gephyrin-like molybdotransferase Glp [Pedobacter aquatilis]
MISVEQAKDLIDENIQSLKPVRKYLKDSSGHILAKDIVAPVDIPAFAQSSMDGYALKFGEPNQELVLVGEMAAGTNQKINIGPGETSRIFTGAPLPENADTVIMQEKISKIGELIQLQDDRLKFGDNVRQVGSEIRAGAVAMHKGDQLGPAAMAFLAGIGINEVEVYPMPRIAVILTGNELQAPGQPLDFGKVYEANSYSLSAALHLEGIYEIELLTAEDKLDKLTEVLNTALKENDVILLTGGVSVGDYDFVLQASTANGVEQIFHKVRQKPGKPLFFGMKADKVIFGLPGNPSSVLNCYYNYVIPALKKLSGKSAKTNLFSATLTHDYSKPKGLKHFLKGNYENGKATPLGAQESYRLSSFAQANCLIELDEELENFKVGDHVRVLFIGN